MNRAEFLRAASEQAAELRAARAEQAGIVAAVVTAKAIDDARKLYVREKQANRRVKRGHWRQEVERAALQSMYVLRERHRDEYDRIYREMREAFGVPVAEADLPVLPVPAAAARRCTHEPEKRSYGIICKLCDTKLN